MRSHSTDRVFTFQCPRSWLYVMALSHVRKNFQTSDRAMTKRRPCRRSSVAWLQERRCHPNFRRFQSVAGADGKASLHKKSNSPRRMHKISDIDHIKFSLSDEHCPCRSTAHPFQAPSSQSQPLPHPAYKSRSIHSPDRFPPSSGSACALRAISSHCCWPRPW